MVNLEWRRPLFSLLASSLLLNMEKGRAEERQVESGGCCISILHLRFSFVGNGSVKVN